MLARADGRVKGVTQIASATFRPARESGRLWRPPSGRPIFAAMRRRWMGSTAPLLLGLAVAGATGCSFIADTVTDNGPVRTETRDVTGFTGVSVGGGAQLSIAIGSGFNVEITAEDRILGLLDSRVEGDLLVIDSRGSYSTTKGVQVTIRMPRLVALELSGGARGTIERVDADTLSLNLSGGAQATVRGTADSLAVEASGGSQAHLRDLVSGSAQVDASGGAQVELTASEQVSGSASGGARVDVWGGAGLSVETSGGSQATAH
jgi:Putative auto-transporter adhesin, head GIN domain